MTKFIGFHLTAMRMPVIILGLIFAATQLYTTPVFAVGASSSSTPKKKCKKGYVWSKKKCVKKTSELLADDDLYWQARAYIEDGKYDMALDLLQRIKNQNQPRVLNFIGFTHRRLGHNDIALGYYKKVLAMNPDHRGANEYLGELYVKEGKLDLAKKQLAKLDKICSSGCKEFDDLKVAINTYEAGGGFKGFSKGTGFSITGN